MEKHAIIEFKAGNSNRKVVELLGIDRKTVAKSTSENILKNNK